MKWPKSLSVFFRCICPKFWTQMHRLNLMNAAFTIHTEPQTQVRPSSALRKTVQTRISNKNNQSPYRPITAALSPLEEMVLAVLEVGGQCGDGGDVLLKSGSLGEKKKSHFIAFQFFIHTERLEEHLIMNCHITNLKELFRINSSRQRL